LFIFDRQCTRNFDFTKEIYQSTIFDFTVIPRSVYKYKSHQEQHKKTNYPAYIVNVDNVISAIRVFDSPQNSKQQR